MDWSPHMSLFRSLRRIAIAVQIAGWCTSALHVASSLAETILLIKFSAMSELFEPDHPRALSTQTMCIS